MSTFEIPLKAQPQILQITLAGVTYKLTIVPNCFNNTWTLDMADSAGVPFLTGVPLVTGCNLLEQHPHLGVGGALIALTDNDPDTPPSFTNLGTLGHLRFVTP